MNKPKYSICLNINKENIIYSIGYHGQYYNQTIKQILVYDKLNFPLKNNSYYYNLRDNTKNQPLGIINAPLQKNRNNIQTNHDIKLL